MLRQTVIDDGDDKSLYRGDAAVSACQRLRRSASVRPPSTISRREDGARPIADSDNSTGRVCSSDRDGRARSSVTPL